MKIEKRPGVVNVGVGVDLVGHLCHRLRGHWGGLAHGCPESVVSELGLVTVVIGECADCTKREGRGGLPTLHKLLILLILKIKP